MRTFLCKGCSLEFKKDKPRRVRCDVCTKQVRVQKLKAEYLSLLEKHKDTKIPTNRHPDYDVDRKRMRKIAVELDKLAPRVVEVA